MKPLEAGFGFRGPAVPPTQPPALKEVCSWCGAVIKDGPGPAEVSHGICAECREKNFPSSRTGGRP